VCCGCSEIWCWGRCVGTRGREEQEVRENGVIRGDIICTLTNHYRCDQIKNSEVDRAYSTYGVEENSYRVWTGKREVIRRLHDLDVRGEDNSKMNLWEVEWEGMGRVHLAKDRYKWWVLVNTVLYLQVP